MTRSDTQFSIASLRLAREDPVRPLARAWACPAVSSVVATGPPGPALVVSAPLAPVGTAVVASAGAPGAALSGASVPLCEMSARPASATVVTGEGAPL
eukprot:11161080-Lingulodinium_polyedra.AAC.1